MPKTPHIESRDRLNPLLTDLTTGGKDKSRIWHTKENRLYHQYRQRNVNTKCTSCVYIFRNAQQP